MMCIHYDGNQYCDLYKSKVASAYCGDICTDRTEPKIKNGKILAAYVLSNIINKSRRSICEDRKKESIDIEGEGCGYSPSDFPIIKGIFDMSLYE